jgi:hypothetical protein
LGGGPDAGAGRRDDDASQVQSTYGVIWRQGAGPLGRGKLELLSRSLRLEGVAESHPSSLELPYESLVHVRVGRAASERISGRPSLVLEPRGGETISIGAIAEPGVIGELAERIAGLRAGRQTAIVLPLRDGSHEAVRRLLDVGPPFRPERIGLDRHHVFLTPSEAVFVFESSQGPSVLEPLLAEPALWERASEWAQHLAGPPRIAESVYSWTRPDVETDHFLIPPGLRDGDGD